MLSIGIINVDLLHEFGNTIVQATLTLCETHTINKLIGSKTFIIKGAQTWLKIERVWWAVIQLLLLSVGHHQNRHSPKQNEEGNWLRIVS